MHMFCRGRYLSLPSHISESCSSLVYKMLKVDPASRIRMEELVKHPWTRYHQIQVQEPAKPGVDSGTEMHMLESSLSGHWTQKLSGNPSLVLQRGSTIDISDEPVGIPEGVHESVKLVLRDWEDKGEGYLELLALISVVQYTNQCSKKSFPASSLFLAVEDPISMAIMRSQMNRPLPLSKTAASAVLETPKSQAINNLPDAPIMQSDETQVGSSERHCLRKGSFLRSG